MKLQWQGWPEESAFRRNFNRFLSGEFYVYTPDSPTGASTLAYLTVRDTKVGWHVLRIERETETAEEMYTAAHALLDVVKIRYQEEISKCLHHSNAS